MHPILFYFAILSMPSATDLSSLDQPIAPGTVEYLIDESGALTYAEVFNRTDFKVSPKRVPSFGYTESTYWFRTKVQNVTSEEDWVVEIGYALLDDVVLYVDSGSGDVQEYYGGDHLPFDKRHRPHRLINFGVKIESGQSATLFFRVKTGGSLQLPVMIFSERSYGDAMAEDTALQVLLYGILVAMIFFNGFLGLSLRDSAYGYYVGNLIFFLVSWMSLQGNFFQWFLPESPYLAEKLIPVSLFSMGFCLARFTNLFLGTRDSNIRYHYFLESLALVAGIGAVASVFVPYSFIIKILVLDALVTIGGILVLGFLCLRTFRPARYFVSSFVGLLLGIIVYLLVSLGLVPSNIFTSNAISLASALQVTLLSLALADRIHILQEEKSASQDALIESLTAYGHEMQRRAELEEENDLLAKEMEATGQALIQADKMASLGQLVAGVAHEIAGPTNYVGLTIGLIRRRMEEIRSLLKSLFDSEDERALKVLNGFNGKFDDVEVHLVQVLGGVEKIKVIQSALRNHGRIDPAFTRDLEIGPILNETLVILGDKIRDVAIDLDISEAGTFEARRAQLGQVFTNLIVNAVDALESNSEKGEEYQLKVIAKRVLQEGVPGIQVEFHDNGPGIPIELRDQIFAPFFTTKEVGKGTGLGMPIVKRIVENHGGDLFVGDSTFFGGACVGFWIPQAQPGDT